MKYWEIYLSVVAVVFMIVPVVRLFVPFFGISKPLRRRLEEKNTVKPYLISHNIISVILAAVCIAGVFLPEKYKLVVCMPLLVATFIAVIYCNMKFIGTPWAYISSKKVK